MRPPELGGEYLPRRQSVILFQFGDYLGGVLGANVIGAVINFSATLELQGTIEATNIAACGIGDPGQSGVVMVSIRCAQESNPALLWHENIEPFGDPAPEQFAFVVSHAVFSVVS